MRAVVQRIKYAHVEVDGNVIASVGDGLAVLLGIGVEDEEADAHYLAGKVAHLRVFEDDSGRLNLSVLDTNGEVLVVSNFTLYGDCRKGRRPSFTEAAPPELAQPLYEAFISALKKEGVKVAHGMFGARMVVRIDNNGPVTLLLDSKRQF
ncbi:MAG: D-aminoacyl-tRNA deacylase [Armatimonadota bacterium]|nr:D-aminoacyl-tRNA deacylase [Armatimonadota bacterium]MCX7777412.1 D-aminoacyl-tRNA deacylase [Armatimonadota bacterium]MDW8025081.1 D-aminoacyl-tRNA deacylase [Armatimonadota bacterium]